MNYLDIISQNTITTISSTIIIAMMFVLFVLIIGKAKLWGGKPI